MNNGPGQVDEAPEVMRRRLRLALRQAREEVGLTQKETAANLYWSVSKIIRIEQGVVPVAPTDVRALLALYAVTDKEKVDSLVDLALGSKKQPWDDYKGVYSPAALTLFGNESAARIISKYEPTYVPGLLQTPEYARTLLRGLGYSSSDVELMVTARIERQELLELDTRPKLDYIIGEGAISTEVGGPDIMLRQFERLKELGARDGISIHILPFSAGAHRRMADAFTILEFGDELDDLLYLENAGRETTTRDDQNLIAEYRSDFLDLEALSSKSGDLGRVLDDIASLRFKSPPSTRSKNDNGAERMT